MKLSTEDKREDAQPSVVRDTPQYPYGLKIFFDERSYEKLQLSEPPKAGDKIAIIANTFVCEVRQSETEGDVPKYEMSLQITDIGLKQGALDESGSEKKDAIDLAEDIYGGS